MVDTLTPITQIYEVRSTREATNIAHLGVNNIGVLVGSGEYPNELPLKQAKRIINNMPGGVQPVALLLSGNFSEIHFYARNLECDLLHLGAIPESITPEDILRLKEEMPYLKIMRSIPIVGESAIQLASQYEGIADYLLLDSHKENDTQVGATGVVHDWNISRRIVETVRTPVILAGGLGPENVAEAIKVVRPYGVDSKTRTDTENGKRKDLKKVEEFVKAAKSAVDS